MIFKHPKAPLVFGILILIGAAAYLTFYRASPGKLSKPHDAVAGLSIITNCNKCHAPKGITAGCLSCHKEIDMQIATKKGFHSFMLSAKKQECASCHSEHHGEEFKLINAKSWEGQDLKNFTHPHTDYKLAGKHKTLECAACHQMKGRKEFTLPDYPDRPRQNTFLGLDQKCSSCHKDIHAQGLAENCEKCHGQEKFRPADFFDHDKYFPLKNGHARIDCMKCHIPPRNAQDVRKAEAFPFDRVKGTSCESCHANPHKTQWRESCESCHSRDALPWNTAKSKVTPKLHALTGFKLAAPHQKASCEECHTKDAKFSVKYPDPKSPGYNRAEKSCEGCHKDAHGGQFTNHYPKCMNCHLQTGFSPVRFGPKEHTSYPLKGAHAAVPCFVCHLKDKETAIRKFKGTAQECAACHKDEHRGQFAANGATRCENCHSSFASWKADLFDHNKSRFKLDEAHNKVRCAACHFPERAAGGQSFVRYKPVKKECKDCHALVPER